MKRVPFLALVLVAAVLALVWTTPLAVATAAVATSYWINQADLSRIAGFPCALMLRRAVRMLLPLVWLPLLPLPPLGVDWGLLAGFALAIALMLPAHREIRDMLGPEMRSWFEPVSGSQKVRDVFGCATGGASQELVYRHMVLVGLGTLPGPVTAVISSALFVGEHIVASDWRQRYDRRDLVTQGLLGLGFATITLLSGSVLGALVGHTLYNAPALIQAALWPRSTDEPLGQQPTPITDHAQDTSQAEES